MGSEYWLHHFDPIILTQFLPQYTSTNTAACSADFTTSSDFRSFVSGSFNFAWWPSARSSGTDSRKGRARHSVRAGVWFVERRRAED